MRESSLGITGRLRRHALPILALAALLALVFRDYLALRKFFTGSDFFRQLVPLLNYQSDCLHAGGLPLWNPYMNFGYPWVDHYLNSMFFPTHLIMGSLLKFDMKLAQLEILAFFLAGGVGVYLAAVESGCSRLAALLTGACFMLSAQMTALPIWSNQVYNAACFPFLIYGYRRAKNSATAFSLTAIISLALAILGGYVAATVLGIYIFAAYVLIDGARSRTPVQSLKFLAVTLGGAVLLALPKLLPFYLSLDSSARTSAAVTRDKTDGFLSVYELMSLLVPVKHYFSLYVGEAGLLALVYAALKKRLRVFDPLLIVAVLSGWLLIMDAEGGTSVLRRLAGAALPFMDLIRFEFMYWYYVLAFLVLFMAPAVDAWLGEGDRRLKCIAALSAALVMALLFFTFYDAGLHTKALAFHLALLGLWLAVALIPLRALQALAVVALLGIEFLVVYQRTDVDDPPRYQDDKMAFYISHQKYASNSFKDKQLVRQVFVEDVTRDESRPTMAMSRHRPYLGIGSYYFGATELMNGKYFSGLWYNHNEKKAFVELRDSGLIEKLDGARLYYFAPYKSGPAQARISFDSITCSGFGFTVNTESAGRFVLRQMFDERWRASVNGNSGNPVKTNDYFIGIALPPGVNTIELDFKDPWLAPSAALSLASLVALVSYAAVRKKQKRLGRRDEGQERLSD